MSYIYTLQNRTLTCTTILYCCFTLMPLSRTLPDVIKAIILLFIVLLGFYGSTIDKRSSTTFVCLTVVICILNLIIYIGEYESKGDFAFYSKYFMMYMFWFPFLLGNIYIKSNNHRNILKIKKVIMLFLCITTLSTLVGIYLFDDPCRALASGNVMLNRYYQMRNIGGYGFIYALTLSIPWLIYQYKERKNRRIILCCILFIFCIIKSSYTTAILIMLCNLFVSYFLFIKRKMLSFCAFSFVAIFLVVCIFNNEFWLFILKFLHNDIILRERISNLRDLFVFGSLNGDIHFRWRLYEVSIIAFFHNPLFGNLFALSPRLLGYHSEMLDLLGGTGILGITILLLVLIRIYSVYSPAYNNLRIRKYYLLAIVVIIFFSFVNTVFGSIELSAILAFLYLPEKQ